MRIGIYVDVAKEEQPRGMGFHVVNLLDGLRRVDHKNEYVLYYRRGLFESTQVFRHCPAQENFRRRPVRFPARWHERYPRLWWDHWLPRAIRRDRIDVFHGPNHFLPGLAGGKMIVSIHDVAFLKMQLYSPSVTSALRHWTEIALQRASRVIALSQNTRRDLETLGVEPERIRVIYGGGNTVGEHQIAYGRREELRQRFKLPERYILFVGTLHPRKNVPFLLRAFARLKQSGCPYGLVLAGRPDSAAEEIRDLTVKLGIASDVIATGYVEDWQVPLLYKMADLFVLPSHYEGFGMIAVEAMAYGVPVIVSDTSSLREVVGDGGIAIGVDDVDGLADAMGSVLSNADVRRTLVARGKVQAEKFTWERAARDTLSLYEEVYESATRLNHGRAASATLTTEGACIP